MEDRQKLLQSFTFEELVAEVRRRMAEVDKARELLAGSSGQAPKNTRMSQAALEKWKGWHAYKEQHPDATVEQWRRAQKRKGRS
jgi:hypothetical protein